MKKNILAGFGLSGLGFADNYKNQLLIYEKEKSTGGHAKSLKIQKYYFDEGAHISHSKNVFFLEKFILKKKIFKISNPKIVSFYKNKEIGYPINISLKTLGIKKKIKIFFDLMILFFQKKKDVNNFEEWCLSNFGETLYNDYFKKYTLKYWRTSPKELDYKEWATKRIPKKNILYSIKSIFANLKNKNLHYNTFYYPTRGGFYQFFKNNFKKHNCKTNSKIDFINLNQKFVMIKKNKKYFNKLFSTIPLPEYLRLIPKKQIPKKIYKKIKNLKYNSTICINFKIKKKTKVDFHWCYFYDKDIFASRMSIISNILNENKNFIIGQIEIFRRNDENIDLDSIINNTKKKIFNDIFAINTNKDIKFLSTKTYKYSYPVPLKNNNIKIIHEWLNKYDIYPFGLYGNWKYMWSDESYLNGKLYAIKHSR